MANPRGNVRELLKKSAAAPSLEELLTHAVAELGGVVAMARLIATEINTAKPNSLARTRLLESLIRGFKSNDTNKQGPRDYALMSDEDLDRILDERVTRLNARKMAEDTIDAEKQGREPQGGEHPGHAEQEGPNNSRAPEGEGPGRPDGGDSGNNSADPAA